MNNRKLVIAIVIIVVVIIIGVVGFLIYRSNKRKKEEAAQQMLFLQQQLAQNPNMPSDQKQGILAQIANLAAMVAAARAQEQGQGQGQVPPGPLPGLGGAGWPPANNTSNPVAPYGFPLKKGSSGNYVTGLQNAINAKCGKNLVADGKFGPLTESAAISCLGNSNVSWTQYRQYVG